MSQHIREFVEENMSDLPGKVDIITRSQIKKLAIQIIEKTYGNEEIPVGLVLEVIHDAYKQIVSPRG